MIATLLLGGLFGALVGVAGMIRIRAPHPCAPTRAQLLALPAPVVAEVDERVEEWIVVR